MLLTEAQIGTQELADQAREAPRHKLILRIKGPARANASDVLIHNLSRTGMLIETSSDLAVSDRIELDLPETGVVSAAVIWNSENLFGCRFDRALPKAAISAAMLRSPAESRPIAPPVRHQPENVSSLDGLESWHDARGDKFPAAVRLLILATLAITCWAAIIAAFTAIF